MADRPRFDLGQSGLVLTSSPVHGDPGQLTEAQNIEFKRVQGLGGMGSRAPLTAFAGPMAGGSVLAAIAVPLPSPVDTATVPTILLLTATGLLRSTDGLTFSAVTLSPAPAPPPAALPFAVARAAVVTLTDTTTRVLYPGVSSGGLTPIVVFNPSTGTATTAFSVTGEVSAIHSFADKVYIGVATNGFDMGAWDGSTASPNSIGGSVIQYDPNLGSHAVIGAAFGTGAGEIDASAGGFYAAATGVVGLAPFSLTDDGTLLYAGVGVYHHFAGSPPGTYNAFGSYHLDPAAGTPAWTLGGLGAFDGSGVGGPTSGPAVAMSTALTNVWGASYSEVSAAIGTFAEPKIYESANGDDFEDGGPVPAGGKGWWGPFMLFGAVLLVARVYLNADGSAHTLKVYQNTDGDGADTTLDKDILGTFGGTVIPGQPYTFSGDLYWPMLGTTGQEDHGYLLKRTAAGAWSKVVSDVNYTGMSVSATLPV